MNTLCSDCDSKTIVTLVPYGQSYMAEVECEECGVSYDTNLTDEDIASLKTEKELELEQEIFCGDCLIPLDQCGCKP